MPSSVALLRGINVGGKNTIPMADLVACFTDSDFTNVRTYIQSGNVVFQGGTATRPDLEGEIETALERRFGIPILVVVRSHADLVAVIHSAPPDHGAPHLRSDVVFLKDPGAATATFERLPPLRDGVDAATLGPGVIYVSRVAEKASSSRLSKISTMAAYPTMTIRNWRTTKRLLEMTAEP